MKFAVWQCCMEIYTLVLCACINKNWNKIMIWVNVFFLRDKEEFPFFLRDLSPVTLFEADCRMACHKLLGKYPSSLSLQFQFSCLWKQQHLIVSKHSADGDVLCRNGCSFPLWILLLTGVRLSIVSISDQFSHWWRLWCQNIISWATGGLFCVFWWVVLCF